MLKVGHLHATGIAPCADGIVGGSGTSSVDMAISGIRNHCRMLGDDCQNLIGFDPRGIGSTRSLRPLATRTGH
jgi:hypothetical protein